MSLFLLVLLVSVALVHCVDRNKFRTCENSAFCKRTRALIGDNAASASLWRVQSNSLVLSTDRLELTLEPTAAAEPRLFGDQPLLLLSVETYESGVFRVRADEKFPRRVRHRVAEVLLDSLQPVSFAHVNRSSDGKHVVLGAPISVLERQTLSSQLHVSLEPFEMSLFVNGEQVLSIN